MRVNVLVTAIESKVVVEVPAVSVEYVDLHVEAMLDTRGMHKHVSDVQVILDSQALSVGKSLSDGIVLDDVLAVATSKELVDSFSLVDQAHLQVSFVRHFLDSINLADVALPTFGKRLSDSVVLTETQKRTLQKKLADAFGVNETLSFSDGSSTGMQKRMANLVVITDSSVASFSKKHSDSVNMVDSGSLICQGYVNSHYFAESYVGKALTF